MGDTVQETYGLLEEAYQDLNKACTKLEWLFSGVPSTEPYKAAKLAAVTAYPFMLEAVDALRMGRLEHRKVMG